MNTEPVGQDGRRNAAARNTAKHRACFCGSRRVQTGLPAGPLLREPAVGAVGVLEAAAAQDNGPKTAEFILERDERTAKKALQVNAGSLLGSP